MFTNTKIRTKILPSLKFSLQYFNTTSRKKKCENKKRFSKNEPKNTLNDNKKSHELKVLPVSRINCDKRIISAENTARFVFDEIICKQKFFSQILLVQRTLFKHSSLSTNTEKFRTNTLRFCLDPEKCGTVQFVFSSILKGLELRLFVPV